MVSVTSLPAAVRLNSRKRPFAAIDAAHQTTEDIPPATPRRIALTLSTPHPMQLITPPPTCQRASLAATPPVQGA